MDKLEEVHKEARKWFGLPLQRFELSWWKDEHV